MEETINLKNVLFALKKRSGLIIYTTIIAVLITGILSYYVLTPVYEASTQLLVSQTEADKEELLYNSNEVQTNLQLINTYFVIIQSPRILNQVINELNLSMTVKELSELITVESEEESQVLTISVENEDPQLAVDIANKIASVFKENIVEIMNVNNVAVLAEATHFGQPTPIKPQPLLNMFLALAVGFMLAIALALVLEYANNTIRNEQDIERYFGVPVLGVIPISIDKKQ